MPQRDGAACGAGGAPGRRVEAARPSPVIARLDRATQYAAASRFNFVASGIVGARFRGDDKLCVGAAPMLNFYGKTFSSRLLIGDACSVPWVIQQKASKPSAAQIVTVALRR